MFLQIPLVIFLRPPKDGGRDDLRDHGLGETSRPSQPGHGILCGHALILIMIEYGGTVLAPHIDSLSVHLGRVMDAPKDIEKTLERNDVRIEHQLYRLGMTGVTVAHHLICGMVHGSPGITDLGIYDPWHLTELRLDAPEASGGEYRLSHCIGHLLTTASWKLHVYLSFQVLTRRKCEKTVAKYCFSVPGWRARSP